MIDESNNPVEWALLIAELDEAREHLERLSSEMAEVGSIDESTLSVQLGHIYAHLNRVWNSRRLGREISEPEWNRYSQFPTDIEPVG